MSGATLQRKVTVTNPTGFHLRPMAAFLRQAMQFQSDVAIAYGEKRVNGKHMLELMLLAAEQGAELILEVSGPDAPAALDALAQILAAPSADDLPETS
jgi:phosphotransferase system HPr (HPr) family protein